MSTRFRMSHNNWDPHLVFPLVVLKHKRDHIYLYPTWGLKIDTVTVDGKAVVPEKDKSLMDDLNFNKVPIGADPYIYQVRRLNLVVAKHFSEQGEYELEKYSIPETARRIVIEYRLRESSDSVGPVLALESSLA
jgi:hypothetical protein